MDNPIDLDLSRYRYLSDTITFKINCEIVRYLPKDLVILCKDYIKIIDNDLNEYRLWTKIILEDMRLDDEYKYISYTKCIYVFYNITTSDYIQINRENYSPIVEELLESEDDIIIVNVIK